MKSLRIIETEDGSSTIYDSQLRETYHSTHGAITESDYVFILKGLDYYSYLNPGIEKIHIFEVGFGTGLNAVLAYDWARSKNIAIDYKSIEAYPLPMSIVEHLNYFNSDKHLRQLLLTFHSLSWNEKKIVSKNFYLTKIHQKLQEYPADPNEVNVVFFDAFAPSKQEEMWKEDLLSKIIKTLIQQGIFVTYCARGQLKRDLKELGCEVETLPGPPGKKEMVRATKIHTP